MGDELVSSSLANGEHINNAPRSYTSLFEEALPYYLAIGMTWDLFWEGDPCAPIYYRKAYEMQREAKNNEMWLQGMYIYDAISRLYPAFNAFVKKGTKVEPYMSAPYPINPKESKDEVTEDREAYERIRAKMEKFISQNNKRFKEGG